MQQKFLLIAALAMLMLVSGCASVKPWDRDLLAEKDMALVTSPVDNALQTHVFFSKEAASGGQGLGGGGCGCN